MTREEAKRMLSIIRAYVDGKTIQYQERGKWYDITAPCFNLPADTYRIKPEPKYRPFKSQKECWEEMMKHQPFGWVRHKNYKTSLWNVMSIDDNDITIFYDCYKFYKAFECFEFTDGTPFGIKED